MSSIYPGLSTYIASQKHLGKIGYPTGGVGFVSTSLRGLSPKVYALDCEMVTTSIGNEVARISVVNEKCEAVYDKYVRPRGNIISYNRPHSGIDSRDLENGTAFEDVQRWILANVSSSTILIGHSLENDFRALKLVHNKVVDVSIVFARQGGGKYSLRELVRRHLKETIQVGKHSSVEDATVCMRIMSNHLEKRRRRRGR